MNRTTAIWDESVGAEIRFEIGSFAESLNFHI